jgi:hypothetical protein
MLSKSKKSPICFVSFDGDYRKGQSRNNSKLITLAYHKLGEIGPLALKKKKKKKKKKKN